MKAPIGVFDSGVGGLTVAKAIKDGLPNESILYFGDTAHLPYGDKSPQALLHYTEEILNFLRDEGCEQIVVACNSASTVLDQLPEAWQMDSRLLNVVDPVVQAVSTSGLVRVGLIGTKRTVQSGIYERKLKEQNPNIELVSLETSLLVPVIEEGLANSAISQQVVEHYLTILGKVDGLILGCTHYPLIKPMLQRELGTNFPLFEAPNEISRILKNVFTDDPSVELPQSDRFLVTDITENFQNTARLFFGEATEMNKIDFWK